jgi:phosphomannomutase
VAFDLSQIIKAYDVRGTVPDQLSPQVARAIGQAFARAVVLPDADAAPGVVVGHDMRDSGPELVEAFAAGLTAEGVNVTRIGLCSTDGLYHASGVLGLPGAMFTASHNPAAYNGIKLCRAGARPVGQATGLADVREVAQAILDDADARPAEAGQVPSAGAGTVTDRDTLADYAAFLRGLVDLSGLRPLKVVVDAGNGMGGHTVPAVLGEAAGLPALPLEIVPLYFELDGTFPNHEANPLEPANLVDLQTAVVANEADLGLAFDGDADRCFVVDERGVPVSPSAVTALVGLREVEKEKAAGRTPTVIYNLITSRAVPDLLSAAGAETLRTRVGHSFIKAEMAGRDAVFGGEHSAHYYFRDNWRADSGSIAALMVLEQLGKTGLSLSELRKPFDRYAASGEINFRVDDPAAVIEQVAAAHAGHPQDRLDGLTVDLGDWWFNLRPSNTEPLLRLNLEAPDAARCAAHVAEVRALIDARS